MRVTVNGQALGDGTVGTQRTRLRFVIPAEALFRGDNLLTLTVEGDVPPEVRMRWLTLRPVP